MSVESQPTDAAGGRAGPFTPLTVVLMVLVGVFAFSALVVLLAYAPDLKSGNDGEAHALSKSAVGFAGMAEALRLAGEPMVINRAALPAASHSGLLILTPPPSVDPKAMADLTFAGPILVVLPKWETLRDPKHRGWVGKAGPIDPANLPIGSPQLVAGLGHGQGVARPRFRAGPPYAEGTTLEPGPIEALQTVAASRWIPVLTDADGRIVLARAPDKPLFVLTDPDLMNNRGVKSLETLTTAVSIVRTLRSGDGPVIFDVRLNGLGRERSVLRLLFDPPFLAVTLCLAAAAALAGFQAFCRFGPVGARGRAIAPGKTALVDNTAALIRLAGREHRMGGRYADLTAELAARAVGAPRGLGGEALVAFLDRLGAARGLTETLSELAIQARMAPTAERLTLVAQRLFRWRASMSGTSRSAPLDPH